MVALDRSDCIVRRDHRHATREDGGVLPSRHADGIDAETGVAGGVAVAERDGAGFPTAAIVAAPEGAEGVEELMVRVGAPVHGLAAAGDNDARAVLRAAGRGGTAAARCMRLETGQRTPVL